MTILTNEYGAKYIDFKNELYFVRIYNKSIKIFGNEDNTALLIIDGDDKLISKVKAKKGKLDQYLNKAKN